MSDNPGRVDIHYVLDKLYYSHDNPRDKGTGFERFIKSFLVTEPLYAGRFEQVWMWSDWPERGSRPDHGIDLVARERDTGDLVAVQCKFFDPSAALPKGEIDSFLAESGKHPFRSRLLVTTAGRLNSAAEAAIEDQQIPVNVIGLEDLVGSTLDWAQFDPSTPEVLATLGRKRLRPHQRTAIDAVRAGLVEHDRGQLIMACGTGKTFTSLRLAEEVVPPGGRVLFLVPSIALLNQSLKEWSTEATDPLRTFAVCSDTKVGKANEDSSVVDLAIPATTDSARLAERASAPPTDPNRRTVVFATYQSLDVVAQAQQAGLPSFDLVICDEAHRTTGVTVAGSDESAFVRVHDSAYLTASKRLYMTATPRLYDEASKVKAGQADAVIASMDDVATFGPEFHRLGFGQAVTAGLLTDYKVLVLTIDEGAVARTFQDDLAMNAELNLPDVARIVGCWNALAKRMAVTADGSGSFATDPEPMCKAVAFAANIKASKRFAETFGQISGTYLDALQAADSEALEGASSGRAPLQARVRHVDGTMNMLARGELMEWLKATSRDDANEARILSNAKCLSEGVDVPSLDAVMFLNPRKSVVDVVQSVGRVMRLAAGKQYGYIILPIAIPAGMTPEQALADNERFKVVWEVLQALRAHDERFNAMVNTIELNKARPPQVDIFHITDTPDRDDPPEGPAAPRAVPYQPMLQLEALDNWREAIYARMVDKVGSRRYWETWAKDVADIVERHTTRLRTLITQPETAAQFEEFVAALRANLNDSITAEAAIDMLSQHLVTKPVFDALFPGYEFTDHNPVARVMQAMLTALEGSNLESETEALAEFYESVRLRAAGIDNAEGKQRVITELYEKFFRLAFPRSADALGIVYTPTQIVDFILRSVNDLLVTEFGTSISAPGVHVLDPFTGTGTFITRLLASGLIAPEDLARKFTTELHANEITLLAYYIAAANIEATFHDLTASFAADAVAPASADPRDWVPFDGIVLADTFQMSEHEDTLDGLVFRTNSERAERQLDLDIRVIVGNPPYSVGQTSGNDNNANLRYPSLDARIEATYADRSSATNKNSLYDSYIRAIRWASDRVGDAGVVGFVTNGGFVDSNTADGLRKSLIDEFSAVYVYNLRGNQRTAGELSRREGGKVFGAGSRNTVAITFLVRTPGYTGPATLHYRDIGDYLSREDKLAIVQSGHLASIDWQQVTPNAAGDWINQRGEEFDTFQPIGSKPPGAIFAVYSGGVKTNRDAWVYNFSKTTLTDTVDRMVSFYNAEVSRYEAAATPKPPVDGFINTDPTKFSWNRADKVQLTRGRTYQARPEALRLGIYRPFTCQHVWFDPELNDMVYRTPAMFPTAAHENYGIFQVGAGSAVPFSVIAVDALPNLHVTGAGSGGQFFARYTYEATDSGSAQGALNFGSGEGDVIDGYRRLDNITDETLTAYRAWYGEDVTKDGIFASVYGLLHSPDYRARFAADLKRSLPRIPRVEADDFAAFAEAGQRLLDLHIGYEDVQPWPLTVTGDHLPADADPYAWFRVEKLKWGGGARDKDRSRIVYNPRVTITGIPDEAHGYLLGSRTALEWIIDRYQVKTDKPSGIVNDPNDYAREVANPRYILDLIAKVTRVSVETVQIVNTLPRLRIVEG
ncbi:MAG TPA: DEAD/DEAH box helicase family protein [Ornithinibacter sp.]|nr:DEAD/DEAH box helicase family protein [Ornithinibacter sp.]